MELVHDSLWGYKLKTKLMSGGRCVVCHIPSRKYSIMGFIEGFGTYVKWIPSECFSILKKVVGDFWQDLPSNAGIDWHSM